MVTAILACLHADAPIVACATCQCVMAVPYTRGSDIHFCSEECEIRYYGEDEDAYDCPIHGIVIGDCPRC